uniref:Uncharacterized protein n=1 Tax=Lactuca sativa TaxID=4236 RepID=A0A9R1WNB4_LACSA|nr:hypothetical protein LSAT_V11C100040650 [Lactuca sativa]
MLSVLYIEIVFSPGYLSSPSLNPYIFITDSSSPFLAPVVCLPSPSSACHHHLLLAIAIVIIVSIRCLLQTIDAFFKLLCSICYRGDQGYYSMAQLPSPLSLHLCSISSLNKSKLTTE